MNVLSYLLPQFLFDLAEVGGLSREGRASDLPQSMQNRSQESQNLKSVQV